MDLLITKENKVIGFLNVAFLEYADIQIGDNLECTRSTVKGRKGQKYSCVANDSKIGNNNNRMSKDALINMAMYGDRFKKL